MEPAAAPFEAPTPVSPPQAQAGGFVPKSGNGLRAGGITMIVHGSLNALAFGLLLSFASLEEFDGTPLRGIALGGLGLSVAELGGGVAMTVIGTRRKREREQWMMRNGIRLQPDGNGMTVMGGILLGMGAIGLSTTLALNSALGVDPTPLDYVSDGLYVAGGAALLGVGLWRRSSYRRWAMEQGYQIAMTPYVAPVRGGGATFGFSGRF
jgi:hypothetical protein